MLRITRLLSLLIALSLYANTLQASICVSLAASLPLEALTATSGAIQDPSGAFQEFFVQNFSEVTMQSYGNSPTFNGAPIRKMEHARGMFKDGIYVQLESIPPRVVKVYKPGLVLKHRLARFVRGSFIASLVGGPAVYRFGTVKDVNSSQDFFFIELEHLFPETHKAFTVKYESDKIPQVFNQTSVKDIADLFARVLEYRVSVVDSDMLFNAKGNFRWVDGDDWNFKYNNQIGLQNFKSFSEKIPLSEDQWLAVSLKIREKVVNSGRFSSDEKKSLLDDFPTTSDEVRDRLR